MLHCLQCQSERVTKGNIIMPGRRFTPVFRPDGLRFFTLALSEGSSLSDRAHACLDCGLVWSTTDKAELASFMRKHCE